MSVKSFSCSGIELGGEQLFLIAGPCVIEESSVMWRTAEFLHALQEQLNVPIIFKSSFQKDNRSSLDNYPGPGLEKGLEILAAIKQKFHFPILTDVHACDQVQAAAQVADILQIPAYLCMQTSLVVQAAKSGKVVNIKHGQFLAPKNMKYPLQKCLQSGNERVFLTERGHSFGYNDLVVDPRAFYELGALGYPVVFDLTHSIRKYGIPSKEKSGGAKEYLPVLARCAAAAGVDGFFIEVHPDPNNALCDAASQLALTQLPDLLKMVLDFHRLAGAYRAFGSEYAE